MGTNTHEPEYWADKKKKKKKKKTSLTWWDQHTHGGNDTHSQTRKLFSFKLKKKVLQGFLYLERGVDDILLVIFRV